MFDNPTPEEFAEIEALIDDEKLEKLHAGELD